MTRLATHRATRTAHAIDPWQDAWEDGRPAEAPRTARSTRPALGWRQGGRDAAEAPDWPDAPTEEVAP